MSKLVQVAQDAQDLVVKHRRYLHRHPETRWEENKTLAYIQAAVEAADPHNCTVRILNGYTGGLVVDVDFAGLPNANRILLRADVDALPIQEETDLPFASTVPGKSHACGHDTHAAMLLGAYRLIVEGRVKSTHNLRFVWQRAEEGPGSPPKLESGGNVLVQEGVLEGIKSVHALHIRSDFERGILLSREGQISGNSDRMYWTVHAAGGHVIHPAPGANALRIIDSLTAELDSFMEARLGSQPYTVEPAVALAGIEWKPTDATSDPAETLLDMGWRSSNIMPGKADRFFALRTLDDETKRTLLHRDVTDHFTRYVQEISQGKATVKVEIRRGHPAMINTDFETVSRILQAARQSVKQCQAELGGEDFAYYLQKAPGSFWYLGAGGEDWPDHHTEQFKIDESVLWQGVLFWLLLATN